MKTLLALDLSTTCTGFAVFDLETKELLRFGKIDPDFKNPKKKGIPKHGVTEAQVLKLRILSNQVIELIDLSTTVIAIEQINRGKNRLGQKVLDGFHHVLLERMPYDEVRKVQFHDSDGADGWRSVNGLKLQLSQSDKEWNKKAKKLNKKLGKGQKKLDVITQKTLACKYVNKRYNLELNEKDGSDIADAIGLGTFVLEKVLPIWNRHTN